MLTVSGPRLTVQADISQPSVIIYQKLEVRDVFHRIIKGGLPIWPVYAYTLAAQNTVIKLLVLILYA